MVKCITIDNLFISRELGYLFAIMFTGQEMSAQGLFK